MWLTSATNHFPISRSENDALKGNNDSVIWSRTRDGWYPTYFSSPPFFFPLPHISIPPRILSLTNPSSLHRWIHRANISATDSDRWTALKPVAGLDIRIANNFVQCIIRGCRIQSIEDSVEERERKRLVIIWRTFSYIHPPRMYVRIIIIQYRTTGAKGTRQDFPPRILICRSCTFITATPLVSLLSRASWW